MILGFMFNEEGKKYLVNELKLNNTLKRFNISSLFRIFQFDNNNYIILKDCEITKEGMKDLSKYISQEGNNLEELNLSLLSIQEN